MPPAAAATLAPRPPVAFERVADLSFRRISNRVKTRQPRAFPSSIAPISATVLVKNSVRWLATVLEALAWCDEVIVLDTGSTDGSQAIAVTFPNVALHTLSGEFPGFGRAHQHAVELARNDWILSIDSDEIVTPELAAEICQLPLQENVVYTVPFENYFNGKHITTCGWSPDWHERLFNRRVTNFCASEVHERVQTKNVGIVRLRHSIRHHSYSSLDDFLRKMPAYAHLFATQNAGKKRASAVKAVSRSAWAFFKSYVLERGFAQGVEGLIISSYKSQTVFWKYLKLREANLRSIG